MDEDETAFRVAGSLFVAQQEEGSIGTFESSDLMIELVASYPSLAQPAEQSEDDSSQEEWTSGLVPDWETLNDALSIVENDSENSCKIEDWFGKDMFPEPSGSSVGNTTFGTAHDEQVDECETYFSCEPATPRSASNESSKE